ncbi:MAG TPA: tail fiber protein [Bryobacteraceae bacterium]
MGGSQPYVGQIIIVPYNFAPAGWMFCQGQLLPISENETLFNLIGTTYGGDGQETFALPSLASRVCPHVGGGMQLAETGGVETVTLTVQQIPQHTHPVLASTQAANSAIPNAGVLAAAGPKTYGTTAQDSGLAANCLSPSGGSQPHENLQPYLALNYIISLFGVFPTPT